MACKRVIKIGERMVRDFASREYFRTFFKECEHQLTFCAFVPASPTSTPFEVPVDASAEDSKSK